MHQHASIAMSDENSHGAVASPLAQTRAFRSEQRDATAIAWGDRTIRVQWSSTRCVAAGEGHERMAKLEFVLSVQPLDRDHAMLEAWIESDQGGRRVVFERRPVRAQVSFDDRLMHIDLKSGGEAQPDDRLAAISLFIDDSAPASRRPLFAQTSLMGAAGFGAGTYDPPIFRQPDSQRDAASA